MYCWMNQSYLDTVRALAKHVKVHHEGQSSPKLTNSKCGAEVPDSIMLRLTVTDVMESYHPMSAVDGMPPRKTQIPLTRTTCRTCVSLHGNAFTAVDARLYHVDTSQVAQPHIFDVLPIYYVLNSVYKYY